MTHQQSSSQPNLLLRFWNRCKHSVHQNTIVIVAGTVGGIMANVIGFSVDLIDFFGLLSPRNDINNYKAGWVLVKITGWSETSYKQTEKMDGFGRFFVQRLRGTSQLTPMIYTDQKPSENALNNGVSRDDDVSVLINVDYKGKVPGWAKDSVEKRNSQTFQARLIQAVSSQEPVCLFVFGIRNNDRSQFLNILQFHQVQTSYADEYNDLVSEDNPGTDRHSQLVNLTSRACGSNTLY